MEIDAYRTVCEAGAFGDFGSRQPFHKTQYQGLTVSVRQGEDGLENGLRFGSGLRRT